MHDGVSYHWHKKIEFSDIFQTQVARMTLHSRRMRQEIWMEHLTSLVYKLKARTFGKSSESNENMIGTKLCSYSHAYGVKILRPQATPTFSILVKKWEWPG